MSNNMSVETKSLSEIFDSMSKNYDAIAIVINNMSQNQNNFDSDSLIKLSRYFENLKNDCNDAVINQHTLSTILTDYVNESKEIQSKYLERSNELKNSTTHSVESEPINFWKYFLNLILFK